MKTYLDTNTRLKWFSVELQPPLRDDDEREPASNALLMAFIRDHDQACAMAEGFWHSVDGWQEWDYEGFPQPFEGGEIYAWAIAPAYHPPVEKLI